ncbi:MAG TPA: DNA repair protein RecO, partial [Desulfurivibrionaceae bacterium]|nr:DNA repair protein RecO [Desulfurivibrionaceae bacterium]
MGVRQTLAVVLQVMDHGDADKIVTCYSQEIGKLAAIAKGAKRSKKRFVNKLEPFSLLDLAYEESRTSSLMRLDQAELVNAFPTLRRDYNRYTAATLLCEQILQWTREHDADPDLFTLLRWALSGLEQGQPAFATVILFEIRMLDLLGYKPNLAGCLRCGTLTPARRPYHFSTSRSGLICKTCNRETEHGQVPVSLETAKLLHAAQHMAGSKLDRLHFSADATRESLALLRRYDHHLLQREVNSWP